MAQQKAKSISEVTHCTDGFVVSQLSVNCMMIDDCKQQPGIVLPTSLATSQVAGVSYPTLQTASALQQPQPPQQPQSATAQKQHRVFTGVITKLHDNFGFIDEDVFFQLR